MTRTFITLSFLFLMQLSFCQNTISIHGKVIDESFTPVPQVSIMVGKKEVASTDFDGKFQTEINKNVKKIVVLFPGMESLTVILKENCNNFELVLLNEGGCFLGSSLRKVDRIRKRRFDSRKKLHKAAFDKGIFTTETFCGEPQFEPYEIVIPKANIDELEMEVNNGGFNQYFINSGNQNCYVTLRVLKKRGKVKTAKLLESAINLINPNHISETEFLQKLRKNEVEELYDEKVSTELNKLDEEFFNLTE